MDDNRTAAWVHLGRWLRGELPGQGPHDAGLLAAAHGANGWFTPDEVRHALATLGSWCTEDVLRAWLQRAPGVPVAAEAGRTVGLVLPGNLPLVGFADVAAVVCAGHRAAVKCAHGDTVLMRAVIEAWKAGGLPDAAVQFVDGIASNWDAVIATGSANTNRYFAHYFGHLPHVFRGTRTSVAVLDGQETDDQLAGLAEDIFRYFGMGCRSVTKVFVPRGYDLDRLFGAFLPWAHRGDHNKYANNYTYHKAVWLLNGEQLVENGFILLREGEGWGSPVGALTYAFHDGVESALQQCHEHNALIQCVVTRTGEPVEGLGVVAMGAAQTPRPWDYADGVDTLQFLADLAVPSTHA